MTNMNFPTVETDLVVVGGGPAGFCAAVAAARQGVRVTLVEKNGFAGGMATAGLVGPFMTCYDKSGETMIIRGLFEEVVERLVERGGAIHPAQVRSGSAYTSWITVGHDHCTPFDAEILKKLIDDMLTEAGVNVLYHVEFLETQMEDNTAKGITVHTKSGYLTIHAKVVIDCTGDGDAAASAGVPFEMGNSKLGIMQPATMFFRICNVDSKAVEADIAANKHLFHRENGVNYRSFHWHVAEARAAGDWTLDRVSIGLYKCVQDDEWCVNTSRIMGIDSTDSISLTRGEIEGRRQVEQILHFLRKYVPGCERAKLLSSASTLGIRESRHMEGEYRLTLEDVLNGAVPEDSVVLCSNSVDVHGRFGSKSNEYITVQNGEYYGIPYRCFVPRKIDGLLFAGRCVSAESEAAGAVRVMPPCMAMGQAVGTAAAIAVKKGVQPRDIAAAELIKELIQNGAYLKA